MNAPASTAPNFKATPRTPAEVLAAAARRQVWTHQQQRGWSWWCATTAGTPAKVTWQATWLLVGKFATRSGDFLTPTVTGEAMLADKETADAAARV